MMRKKGFLDGPHTLAVIVFALMVLAVYGWLVGGVGVPMLSWAQAAVPSQIDGLLAAIGC